MLVLASEYNIVQEGIMKKRIMMALLGMTWHTLAMGQPFNGPYGGVNLGVIGTDIKNVNSLTIFLPNAFNIIDGDNKHTAQTGFNGGLALGFGFGVTERFILGIEGRWNIENITTSINGLISETNSQLEIVKEADVKLKNDLSILLKASAVLDPKTIFFGLIGPQWGIFDIASQGNYMQNLGVPIEAKVGGVSKSIHIRGLLLGVGMEHLFSNHCSIGIEYARSFYRKYTAPDVMDATLVPNGVDVTATLMNEIHPSTNVASLKFTYYICPRDGTFYGS